MTHQSSKYSYTISDPAYEVLCRDFKKKPDTRHVISFRETRGHDGYDAEGPKSDLWDFFVIALENGEHVYYNYHWENWFQGDPEEYDLFYRGPVSQLTGYHLKMAQQGEAPLPH